MTSRRVPLLALGLLACGTGVGAGSGQGGCALFPPNNPPRATVDLQLVSIEPATVDSAGIDVVTVRTKNGCHPADASLIVDGQPVSVDGGADAYTFTAPPETFAGCEKSVDVTLTCSETVDPDHTDYGIDTVHGKLTYQQDCPIPPVVENYEPYGSHIPREAKAVVAFSVPIDPASVTADSFHIVGVAGTTSYDASMRTATFTPNALLDGEQTYTVEVLATIHDPQGRPLATHLAADGSEVDPAADRWPFSTAKDPLLDVAARAPEGDAVASDAPCQVTFNEPIDPATLTVVSFHGLDASSAPMRAGVVSYDESTLTATFQPSAAWPAGENGCSLDPGTGGQAVLSANGSPLRALTEPFDTGAEVDWHFTVVGD